jgi:hypothetical protein
MNNQERELLNAFLHNLTAAQPGTIDREAATLIQDAVARQPNAAYLLVQQALVQQVALREAQARIADLEQQTRPSAGSPTDPWSFLGAGTPTRGAAVQGVPRSVGFGDFLRSAASTAAGVAGGALLFQGIENLFGMHRGGSAGGLFDSLSGAGSMGGGAPREIVENTTVVNEYAGDAGDRDEDYADDRDYADDEGMYGNDGDPSDWV